jgi:2-dehydropantoate 2-reductase
MTKLALIGPGAIGGTISAWLLKENFDLQICARSKFERLAVETPIGLLESFPNILTSIEEAKPVDWVFVATKAYDSKSASTWLAKLLGPSTKVAVIQNGIEHLEHFRSFMLEERIIPVIAELPAEKLGTGHFLQRRRGKLTIKVGQNSEEFRQLFANALVDVDVVKDFKSVAWRKLASNSAGAVCAITLKPFSVSHNESAAAAMRLLVQEAVAVGRAEGAIFDDDFDKYVVEKYRAHAPDQINSLHADRIAQRPMEIDARHGIIIRLGKAHGIPTPANSLVEALLKACI